MADGGTDPGGRGGAAPVRPADGRPHHLGDILAKLASVADRDRVTVADLLAVFGPASFVPALTVPALIVVSPLSGIPMLPSVCGVTIGLIALQMAARRRHLWLPGVIRRRSVPGPRLARATGRLHRVAGWIDRHTVTGRLGVLLHEPMATMARLLCAASGLVMPMLELVPLSSSILGCAVVLFAVGFLARDGLYVLSAVLVMAIAALVPVAILVPAVG